MKGKTSPPISRSACPPTAQGADREDGGRCRLLLPATLAAAAPTGATSTALGGDVSPESKESLRKTAERRRGDSPEAVGSIVTYPMPPAPIIRQTPERHDEV